MKTITISLLALFFLTSCIYPNWYFDSFKINANFESNGKCSFEVNGTKFSDDNYRQSIFDPSSCGNCTEDHLKIYIVFCKKPYITGSKDLSTNFPLLGLNFVVSKGDILKKGEYEVTDNSGKASEISTGVLLMDHQKYRKESFLNGLTGADLSGVSGKIYLIENFKFIKQKGINNKNWGIQGKVKISAQRRPSNL